LNITIRILSTSVVLFATLAQNVLAQESQLPAFDSFSYLRDSLFGGAYTSGTTKAVEPGECTVPQAVTKPQAIPAMIVSECPEISVQPAFSNSERFELQLALDKALSQILKLTVDYEALRTRVQRLDPSANKQGYSQQGRGKLQKLVDLHEKQLSDRDRQLLMLQGRLETAQSRYDSEYASRLLAEKQLKVAGDKDNKAEKVDTVNNKQFDLLSEQLEKNKATIRQLKADLQTEQSARVLLNANKVALSEETGQQEIDEQMQSSFKVSKEWVIDGLRFKQGSADIEPDSTQNLNLLAEHLKQNSDLSAQINGYTDSVGSVESNLRLSQARAESVASYLIGQGVEFYRIKALGYGERRSLGNNDTEQGRLQNRRVAVLFLN